MSDLNRKQFEEWFDESGFYKFKETAWAAWEASREGLVIELPEPYAVIGDYAACGGGRLVWDVERAEMITDKMCEKTVVYDRTIFEEFGLKVKP